jgi:hypothetical protein
MHKNQTHPASVTILAVVVLSITFWYAIRVYSAIKNWQILTEFGAIPTYILGTGIFWILAGLWLIAIFWQRKPHAVLIGSGVAVAHFLWYWFDRLIMQPTPAPNVIFSLVGSTLGMAVFLIILNLPASRSFFNKE